VTDRLAARAADTGRRTAIMQPYFLPYAGYWQLIAAVDRFIVYDAIKYTKKGWINRNRMLRDGAPAVFTLPLKRASDDLDVRDREIAPEFRGAALLARVKGAYRRAPHAEPTLALLERILETDERNLFAFLERSIRLTCDHLAIATPILTSSAIAVDPGLRGQDRVLAICEAVGTDRYVNAIGGVELYDPQAFRARGIDLRFLRSRPIEYPQLGGAFVPQLSILDVLMFNPLPVVREIVHAGFELV
jgi:hypothetical protein